MNSVVAILYLFLWALWERGRGVEGGGGGAGL